MLRNNEALAALSTRLDPRTHLLTIRQGGAERLTADLSRADGRQAAEDFFADYLGAATRGRPRMVRADGHKFTDASVLSPMMMRAISVINLASVRALEAATGQAQTLARQGGGVEPGGVTALGPPADAGHGLGVGGGVARARRAG